MQRKDAARTTAAQLVRAAGPPHAMRIVVRHDGRLGVARARVRGGEFAERVRVAGSRRKGQCLLTGAARPALQRAWTGYPNLRSAPSGALRRSRGVDPIGARGGMACRGTREAIAI